jgi:signal peptidase I
VTTAVAQGGRSWRRALLWVLLALVIANLAVFAVERLLYTPFWVPTNSMWPTLMEDDRVLVDRNVALDDVERGDLVVLAVKDNLDAPADADASDKHTLLVKRVVALPGEAFEAHRGVLAIDATERIPEPYLLGRRGNTEIAQVDIPDGRIYVLGDNRNHSIDSRQFGTVPDEAIVGKVVARVWPLDRAETL